MFHAFWHPFTRAGIVFKAGRAYSQHSLAAAYYRGGTSRALFFALEHLPEDREAWAPIFRGVIGSPDPDGRQLDGMGGGVSSLSKICVVGPSAREDADVDFTFAAVGVRDDVVDYSSNCGNMLAAVGPYAVDYRLFKVPGGQSDVTVRIHNTNTGKIIHAMFPVSDGEAMAHGDFAIDGVAGTAARIELRFIDPGGAKTGRVWPTGSSTDAIAYGDGKTIEASCIDVANPSVFVRAKDLGVTGSMSPDQIDRHPTLLSDLNSIRRAAAVKMGLAEESSQVPASIPKICLIAPPSSHTLPSGTHVAKEEIDVLVRALSVGQPHKAIPVTTSLGVAAASKFPGSIVQQVMVHLPADVAGGLTIGHASGKLVVNAEVDQELNLVHSGIVYRTARRLMEGRVFWK